MSFNNLDAYDLIRAKYQSLNDPFPRRGEMRAVPDNTGLFEVLANTIQDPQRPERGALMGGLGQWLEKMGQNQPTTYGDRVAASLDMVPGVDDLAAKGLMGAMPMMAGIFGGKKALTANLEMLKIAREAAEKGMSKERIMDATGWFKGKDGQWRSEINDSLSSFSSAAANTPKWGPTRGIKMVGQDPRRSAIQHDPLLAAYPQTGDIRSAKTEKLKAQGAYLPPIDATDPGSIYLSPQTKDPRSTGLHELQHAVQQSEGFAVGGTPSLFKEQRNEGQKMVKRWNESLRDLAKQMKEAVKAKDATRAEALGARYNTLLNRRDRLINAVEWNPFEAYKKIAGETEARNVQTRRNLSADDRRMLFPWLTEDVPAEKQIVRYR